MRNQIRFFYLKIISVILISILSYSVLTFEFEPRSTICGIENQLLFLVPDLNLPETADYYWLPPQLESHRYHCQELPGGKLLSRAISSFPKALTILYPQLEIFLFDQSTIVRPSMNIPFRIENVGRGMWLTAGPSASPFLNLSQSPLERFELPISLTAVTITEGVLTADLRQRATELRTSFKKTAFEISWLRRRDGHLELLARDFDGQPQKADCRLAPALSCANLAGASDHDDFPQEDLSACERVVPFQRPTPVPDANTYLCLALHIEKLTKNCDPQLSRFALQLSPYALPIVTTLKVAQCLRKTGILFSEQNWIDSADRSTILAGYFAHD